MGQALVSRAHAVQDHATALYNTTTCTCVLSTEAYSGDATWYNSGVGLGACGSRHDDTELVAATAFHFWTNANPNNDYMCFRLARVTNPQTGASVIVRIRDKCFGCKWSGIDLSPAAFQLIQPGGLDVGRFQVSWEFIQILAEMSASSI